MSAHSGISCYALYTRNSTDVIGLCSSNEFNLIPVHTHFWARYQQRVNSSTTSLAVQMSFYMLETTTTHSMEPCNSIMLIVSYVDKRCFEQLLVSQSTILQGYSQQAPENFHLSNTAVVLRKPWPYVSSLAVSFPGAKVITAKPASRLLSCCHRAVADLKLSWNPSFTFLALQCDVHQRCADLSIVLVETLKSVASQDD